MRWPWAARTDGGEHRRHSDLEQVVCRMEVVAARMVATTERLERVVDEIDKDRSKG